MPPPPPRVRVVVQLPYNRPENPYPDPPHIEWNAEKANILWEVIALSRTSDNGGTDWKGLAAHLQVPLPYLLYRAQVRYEEDLRGLQDIRGVLSGGGGTTPSCAPATIAPGLTTSPRSIDATPLPPMTSQPHRNTLPNGLAIQIPTTTNKIHGASLSARRLSASGRVATPLGVRARLNSLTHRSPVKSRSAGVEGKGKGSGLPQGHGKTSSSSIATLQGAKRPGGAPPPRVASPFSPSDESGSEEDEEAIAQKKEEEAERAAEERQTLDKKLAQLTRMMTSDRVGLVRSILGGADGEGEMGNGVREGPSSGVGIDIGRMGGAGKGKEREIIRGRPPMTPAISNTTGGARQTLDETPPSGPSLAMGAGLGMGFMRDASARGRDHSASVSSASSPQGSIPSIPSPPPLSPGPSSPRIRPRQVPPRHSTHPQPQARTQETPVRVQSQGQIQNQIQNALSSSPMTRHFSPSKSSSPPALSVRNARGHTQVQGRGQGYGGGYGMSEGESNHGSSASSFSDISDASLSASALESALMSNIRGPGGSRFSAITRSKFGVRGL